MVQGSVISECGDDGIGLYLIIWVLLLNLLQNETGSRLKPYCLHNVSVPFCNQFNYNRPLSAEFYSVNLDRHQKQLYFYGGYNNTVVRII